MKKIKSVQKAPQVQQPKEFKQAQIKPLEHEMREMRNAQDLAIAPKEPKEQLKEPTEKIAVRVIEDKPVNNMHAVRKLTPPTPQIGIIEPDTLWKLKMTALVADEDRELVAVKAELKAQYLATVTERVNGIQNTYRARRDERVRALIEKEGGEFMANYQVAPDFSTIHVFPDDMVGTNR